MTQCLYLNDSYLTQCVANVLACTPIKEGYAIELDRTVFFPASGGQPHDTGTIGDAKVFEVAIDGERVVHFTSSPLNVGAEVLAKLDWPRRLDHMQQHSGEHMLSFAAKELYGAVNVGFHMAADYCTVDFDMPFDQAQLDKLEVFTNATICLNLPVHLSYVSADELNLLNLRKAAKGLSGRARVVHMPGGDSCTCCGTHVARTGEIGGFKITDAMHYKGGERITFVCGARALKYVQEIKAMMDVLARSFSCKPGDVSIAVNKIKQENSELKREQRMLYARLNMYIERELLEGAKRAGKYMVISSEVDLPVSQLRPLSLSLASSENVLALLCAKDGDTVNYALTCPKKLDAGELLDCVNAALNGKGGGRGTLAQGSAKFTQGLLEALAQLEEYFCKRLETLK